MEKHAFIMKLHKGQEDEYRRRHDAIWPELVALLKDTGISDYSIHLDRDSGVLFGVLWIEDTDALVTLPGNPVMRRWWDHMKDIMETEPDGSPVSIPLENMFHME